MRLRDVIVFGIGLLVGALLQHFTDDPRRLGRLLRGVKVFRRSDTPLWWPRFLGWKGEDDQHGRRVWPPNHPGGADKTTFYHRWAFDQIQAQGLTNAQAWAAVVKAFPEMLAPGGVQLEKLQVDRERNAFMRQMRRMRHRADNSQRQ